MLEEEEEKKNSEIFFPPHAISTVEGRRGGETK